MKISIRPDKKLYTKTWMILTTITLLAVGTACLLLVLIPLGKGVSAAEVLEILVPVTVGSILLMWAGSVPITYLWIRNLRYEIDDDRIIVCKGILTKVQKNIPYRAITDFILHRSLFDRWLGIASIRVQTAGQTQSATGYEGNIAGLIDWGELHNELRGRIRALHPRSHATAVEEPESASDQAVLTQILGELRAVRKHLERER